MQYNIGNYASQTTAAPVKVTTGTSVKTMLQVAPVLPMRIVEWGCSFDGSSAATPGQVELIETGTVFATVTAHVTAGITRYDSEALLFGDPATLLLTLSTGGTGFTATVEGSITASRNLAGPQLIAPTNQFIEQFPLGYRPIVQSVNGTGYAMRIRMTFGTAINAYCYVIVEFNMKSGAIVLSWDSRGEMNIKVSLPLDGDNKKLVVNALLDAAKAMNNTGSTLVIPEGPGAKIFAG